VAGDRYEAGGLHRFLFGSDYRQVWTTPVEAEVLDLETFAGGLTPTGTGGGKQTLSLRFVGEDGRPYTFRALDKDPSETLPKELRGTAVSRLYQDQISSAFPTGHLVVPRFLQALGILHAEPRLVILPDDPLLGEHRSAFAGQIGMLEEWPNEGKDGAPGFAGATDVVSSDELMEILQGDPRQRIATEEYLTARLLDLFVGDWDRHRGQWRWANVGPGDPPAWRPIPEDRDQAFVRFDGLILGLARDPAPQLTKFSRDYPGIFGATWNGRDMDRRLLVGLERSRWEERARAMQVALGDSVIEEAVRRLPRAHYDLAGSTIVERLRARREKLVEMAGKFYEFLAREVNVHATDAPESVSAIREDGEFLTLSIAAGSAGTTFRRRFDRRETREIRLFLHDGPDRVAVTGGGGTDIKLRVVSRAGADEIENLASHGQTKIYAPRRGEEVTVEGAPLVTAPSIVPEPEPGEVAPRDWGSRRRWRGYLAYSPDFGLVIGARHLREGFGFRKHPWAHRTRILGAIATLQVNGKLDFQYVARRENSRSYGGIRTYISGLENVNFYGLGNEIPLLTDDAEFYRMRQTQILVLPSYTFGVSEALSLSGGIGGRWSHTDLDSTRYVGTARPYGSQDFGMVGAGGGVHFDTRDLESAPSKGFQVELVGAYYPEVWDVSRGDFGEVHGEASTWLSPGKVFTLGLHAGGKKVWGPYPFQEAAYVGGAHSLRGFPQNRYGGDASLYGSAELIFRLGRFMLLLPNEYGIVGLGDVGRVWLEGESSDRWHSSVGAGLWLAPVYRENTTVVGLARSHEGTRFYFLLGLGF
jgi:hypothetical protein